MTPVRGSTVASESVGISLAGSVHASSDYVSRWTRPVVYLNADVYITTGTGSSGSMYQLGI